MCGKSSSELDHLIPSIVIRRPLTTTLLPAVSTNRFTRWKKSSRLKKLPVNSSCSGTVSSPAGAVVEELVELAPAVVDVWVSEELTPDCCAALLAWSEVLEALLADSTAPPGALWAVWPPAATGGALPLPLLLLLVP